MKKTLLLLLTIATLSLSALGFTACNPQELEHTHVFDKQVISADYLKVEATCNSKAMYYVSCECGEKSTEIFESGELASHKFTNYVSDNNATCEKDGTKTATCDYGCGMKDTVTDTGSKLSHVFDKEVVEDKYLKLEATCKNKAEYYKSCVCGESGTDTFEIGETAKHEYVDGKCKWCEDILDGYHFHDYSKRIVEDKYLKKEATCKARAEYYKSCECGEYGEETFKTGDFAEHKYINGKCKWCEKADPNAPTQPDNPNIPDNPEHACLFNQMVAENKYLKSEATCKNKALYYYSCECGEIGEDSFEHGSALGHAYGDFVSIGNGQHKRTCANDNSHTITENCSGGTATCTKKAVCVDCGLEYGSLEKHNYIELKKSETQHWYECACGDKTTPENHKGGEATCTKFAECSVCFEEFGELGEHNYGVWVSNNDRTHTKVCLNDSSHTVVEICFEESDLIHEISCSLMDAMVGIPYTNCDKCNYFEIGEFVFTHEFEVTQLYNNEQHWYDCSVCYMREDYEQHNLVDGKCFCGYEETTDSIGLKYTLLADDTYEVYSLGTCTHLDVIIPSKFNGKTVTSIGKYAFDYRGEFGIVSSNKYYYEDEDFTKLTSVTIPNTVTNIGERAFGGCEELTVIYFAGYKVEWDNIQKGNNWIKNNDIEIVFLQHDYNVDVIEPTCEEQGYIIHTCLDCGDSYKSDYVDATGHKFTSYVYDNNATCEEDGTETAYCDNGCGKSDSIVKDNTAFGHIFSTQWESNEVSHWHECTCGEKKEIAEHEWDEGDKIQEASCTKEGKILYVCVCCSKEKIEIIPITHNYIVYCSDVFHWYACEVCNFTTMKTYHTYINGICVCGELEKNLDYDLYLRLDIDGNIESDGQYVLFGTYPQTDVTEIMAPILNEEVGTPLTTNQWKNYNYYINGNVEQFMWYIDLEHEGYKYRGVYFEKYRPNSTIQASREIYSLQDDNGYFTDNIYWFRYDPIFWKILDEDTGLLLSETILDSQEFYHAQYGYDEVGTRQDYLGTKGSSYENNYQYSNVRTWLNTTFYLTAFDSSERLIIRKTDVDNTEESTNGYSNPNQYFSNKYTCNNTRDKVFLLSHKEMINTAYGFSEYYNEKDSARMKKTTSYSQCQGAYTDVSADYYGNGYWFLRSSSDSGSFCGKHVWYDGVSLEAYLQDTRCGIVPLLHINLDKKSETDVHYWDNGTIVRQPSCKTTGIKRYRCMVCGKFYDEELKALGHDAVLSYDGPVIDRWYCKRCGDAWETGWIGI